MAHTYPFLSGGRRSTRQASARPGRSDCRPLADAGFLPGGI